MLNTTKDFMTIMKNVSDYVKLMYLYLLKFDVYIISEEMILVSYKKTSKMKIIHFLKIIIEFFWNY